MLRTEETTHSPQFIEISIFICDKQINMFNNDLITKLTELKRQSEDSKVRLAELEITEEAGNGLVRIAMNGNRELKSVKINADITQFENEDLEDLICVAFNRALDKVNELNEKEVMSSAQSLFSGM